MELRDLLGNYSGRFDRILEKIEKELERYTNIRYYTDHGGGHAAEVEKFVNKILPDEKKEKLSPTEIFLLLSAIHLHDMGMICVSSEQTRKKHHEYSKDLVITLRPELDLNEHEARIIGEICWAHGLSKKEIEKLGEIEYLEGKIRKQFLIALVRLGDILNVQYRRAPEIVYQILKKQMPHDSRVIWREHQVFQDVEVDSETWSIFIEARPREEVINGERLRDKVIRTVFKIQEELDNWTGLLEKEKLYYKEILLRLESQGIFLPVRVWMEMLQREKMVSKMISLFKDRNRKKVIGFLKEIVKNQNEDQYVRGAAIEELKVLKAKEALPELIQLVNDKYPRIRKLALEAIADIAPYTNIEIIFKKSKDEEDRDVREVAQNLIRGLKREHRFVKFMLSILPKKEWRYTPRDLAIEKLKEFKEKRALKILKKINRDETEDENLREATREVIKVLEEGNA